MALTWKHRCLGGLVLAGLVGWFAWRSNTPPLPSHSVTHTIKEGAPHEDAALLTSSPSHLEPASSDTASEAENLDEHHAEEEVEHPHPITPEHERIFEENRTIQALNDSMALRDVSKMRELLSKYRRLDPQDAEATQAGYAVIADCIEHPGSASLAAASHFYDTEHHSPLRRFVRRICFENAD